MAGKEIIEYLFKGNPTDLLQATEKVKSGLNGVGKAGDKAAAEVDQSFSRMASGMKRAGDKMQTVGKALTVGVTLPLAYALKQMTDAAVADQAAMAKLEGSLKRTTGATRAQLDEVNKFIDSTMRATAVADDDLRPAFERLARSTGNIEQAQRQLNIAIDASRATGKDLSSITEAMAKANMGNVGALGRLGIGVRDANGEMMAMNDVLTIMEQKFRGASSDWMRTTAGQAELNRIKFGELQEQLGGQLVPVMEDLVAVAGFVIDKFTELPDWAQKAAIAMLLLKGPVIWLAGTGVKMLGSYVAQLYATRTATDAVAASSVRLTGLTTGTAAGLSAAGTAMAGNLKLTGGVLGFAGALNTMAAAAVRIGTSLYVFVEGTKFVNDFGNAVGKTGVSIQSWVNAVDSYADANRWQGLLNVPVLFTKVASSIGLLPKPSDDASGSVDTLVKNLDDFNQMILGTPTAIDPAKQKLQELAKATGWSEEELDALNAQVERFTEEIGLIDKTMAADRAMRDLATTLAETKAAQDDASTATNEQADAIDRLKSEAVRTADTMVQSYMEALRTGQITEQQATQRKAELLGALERVKAEAPQTAGTIDQLAAAVNRVPTRRQIDIVVNGVEAAVRGADRLAEAFRNMTNDARTATAVSMTVPQAFRGGARGVLGREAGGTMGFAKGGIYPQNSGGGITSGLTYVLGEGRQPREYVIPTDPQYSRRAQTLLGMASAELGVPRQQVSSTFAPVINVSGGTDPQATAAAVADAVEQAFARKKRREGSLAFS